MYILKIINYVSNQDKYVFRLDTIVKFFGLTIGKKTDYLYKNLAEEKKQ